MNVNELRIGNLLDYNGKIVKVNTLAIDFHGNQTILASKENFLWNVSEIDGIKPIPITEEWLLKFGFRHVKNNWYNIHAKGNTFNVYLFEDSSYRVEIVSQSLGIFKHVHTLQNLYFALSEKELVVSDAVS